MLLKIFGAIDLFATTIILALHFELPLAWRIVILASAGLIIKGVSFWGDIASLVDIIIGVYILLIWAGFTSLFDIIIALYLLQKAIKSFM